MQECEAYEDSESRPDPCPWVVHEFKTESEEYQPETCELEDDHCPVAWLHDLLLVGSVEQVFVEVIGYVG